MFKQTNLLTLKVVEDLQVSMTSERKQRKLAIEVLGDNLTVEKVAFTFPAEGGGTEVKDAPLAYAPNLVRKVADLIAYHFLNAALTEQPATLLFLLGIYSWSEAD